MFFAETCPATAGKGFCCVQLAELPHAGLGLTVLLGMESGQDSLQGSHGLFHRGE